MPVDLQLSEEEIIALLKERDPRGMRYLYDKFSAALFGIVFKIVPVQEVAEEILQETFVKIWQNFSSYDAKKGRLYTWMLNIARNLAIDKTRSTDFKNTTQTQNVDIFVHTTEAPESDTTNPEHIGLKEIVETLRVEQKELIDLIYFKGFTQAEAAEKLKMPLGTVKTRVRSAMTELRKLFQLT
ncbi:MAG: sigma-70 family RNA polymerase sigma factor [Sphingobacteriales bacterium]|nr:MAG: sigma-70 family RNA polymerase sigma factor [Sphingobacteriales bacterium]